MSLYNYKWQKARDAYKRINTLCVRCSKPVAVVDHIIPHRGDPILFWDINNWASLCLNCHNSWKQRLEKSGREAGCTKDGIPIDSNHHWNNKQ
jgi:5-methylcytosine-specific restriction endonuclease McrA